MNGASADPCANTSSPPTSSIATMIGSSTHFFRTFTNAHNSAIRLIDGYSERWSISDQGPRGWWPGAGTAAGVFRSQEREATSSRERKDTRPRSPSFLEWSELPLQVALAGVLGSVHSE